MDLQLQVGQVTETVEVAARAACWKANLLRSALSIGQQLIGDCR